MRLFYEDVDITRNVAINRCEHETYAENRADSLMLRFSDASSAWDLWRPQRGDRVRFTDGIADTGEMFVSELVSENGLFTIYATAMPLSGENTNSRTWENVRLFQLGRDIAARHGLIFKRYDIADQFYAFIQQERQTDFRFLNELCRLEGYALIVYDGQLVIYDESNRENEAAETSVTVGADGRFRYADNSAHSYGAAEIVSGAYHGVFADPNAPADRILNRQSPIACTSNAEAQRYARGLLRQANKNAYIGCFRQKLTKTYSAGSVLNLKTEKASGWNGKVIVTRTRCDYVHGESKIFFRRPLEGY